MSIQIPETSMNRNGYMFFLPTPPCQRAAYTPSADHEDSELDPPRQPDSGPDAGRSSRADRTDVWPSTSPSAGESPPPPVSTPGEIIHTKITFPTKRVFYICFCL